MKVRDDKVYLSDILEAITHIQKYVDGLDLRNFSENIMVIDAVIRRFEIIGEASSKVSADLKKANPEIEWALMKDMRNKLSHEYFGLSPETIFETIVQDLPRLNEKVQKVLQSLNK